MMLRIALLSLLLLAGPALAVQPDEVLPDPALEARARELGQVLRCPVCQGENIDESNAEVSRDLRILVRERLMEGDTDSEVLDYVTDRYGEYVLFEPDRSGANLLLWLVGPIGFLIALAGGFAFLRSRSRADPGPVAAPLSDAERNRLDEILKD